MFFNTAGLKGHEQKNKQSAVSHQYQIKAVRPRRWSNGNRLRLYTATDTRQIKTPRGCLRRRERAGTQFGTDESKPAAKVALRVAEMCNAYMMNCPFGDYT